MQMLGVIYIKKNSKVASMFLGLLSHCFLKTLQELFKNICKLLFLIIKYVQTKVSFSINYPLFRGSFQ